MFQNIFKTLLGFTTYNNFITGIATYSKVIVACDIIIDNIKNP